MAKTDPFENDIDTMTSELDNTGIEPEVTGGEPSADEVDIEIDLDEDAGELAEQPAEPDEESAGEPSETPQDGEDEAPAAPQPKPQRRSDNVPLKTHITTVKQLREARRKLAQYEAAKEFGGEAPAPKVEDEKGPIDTWIESHAEALKDDPDLAVPAAILKADREWQRNHVQLREAQQTAQQRKRTLETSIAVAQRTLTADEQGEGLDFDTVTDKGADLLTADDRSIIRAAGSQAGEEMYARCLRRAREAGDEDIRSALKARRRSLATNPAPNSQTRPKTSAAQNTSQQPARPKGTGREPLTRQEILRRGSPVLPSDRLGIKF
jgi:hypothetical protein